MQNLLTGHCDSSISSIIAALNAFVSPDCLEKFDLPIYSMQDDLHDEYVDHTPLELAKDVLI